MTTKHIPKTGRRPTLTRLPDPPKPPDAMKQLPHVSRANMILDDYYRDRPDVLVGGEGYLCYDASDLRRALKPDCLVAFGLEAPPPEDVIDANGYVISEVGKPPDFVLEVASESTGVRDYTVKRDIYAALRVREQWRFDHTGGLYHDAPLAGDRRINGEYVPISIVTGPDGVLRGYSEVLGLELHWDRGELRFWDPATGEYLPDLTEAKAQRDAEAIARQVAVEQRDTAVSQRDTAVSQRDAAVSQRDAAIAQRDAETEARQAAEERIRQLESELRRLQSDS